MTLIHVYMHSYFNRVLLLEPPSISGSDVNVSVTVLLPHKDLAVKLSFPVSLLHAMQWRHTWHKSACLPIKLIQCIQIFVCPQATKSCPGKASGFYRVYVKSANNTVMYVSERIPSVTTNGSVSVIDFLIHHGTLTVRQVYSITIAAENEAGSSNSTGNIQLCMWLQ